MPPYNCLVHDSFKEILLSHCDKFLRSSGCGLDKTQSKLITQVSQQIADVAKGNMHVHIPDDLEKVPFLFVPFVCNVP